MNEGLITVTTQATREQSSTKQMALGTLALTRDGRRFRYVLAGGVSLAAGLMNQQSAIVADHSNMATAAAAVGASKITVTLAGTAATLNQYAEGYLLTNDGTGQGTLYKVAGNPAAALSTSMVVKLEEPLIAALDANSETTLLVSKYSGVIVVPSAATSGGAPVGVANNTITNAYYGWVQSGGPCAMLSGTTPQTLGDNVSQEASGVAGSASPAIATAPIYGVAMQLGVATEYQVVDLRID